MDRIFAPDGLLFQCRHCGTLAKANPEDTLIQQRSIEFSVESYETLLSTIYDDPANPVEAITCPICKKEVLAKYIRVSDQMKKKYMCPDRHVF